MNKLTVSMLPVTMLIGAAVLVTFAVSPRGTTTVGIDQLQLISEDAVHSTLAGDTCPIKGNHTSCQQSVATGAFAACPTPRVAL